MSRLLLSLVVVCAFAVVAQAAISHTVEFIGSVEVTGGTVDVYQVSFDAGVGRTIGAVVLDVGVAANDDPNDPDPNFADPYQVWYKYHRTVPPPHVDLDVMTPTADDIAGWGEPYENTDTHFLPTGMADWSPVVTDPTESNDGTIADMPYSPGGYKEGLGSLSVAISVPVLVRTQEMDMIQVGVYRTSTVAPIVYCKAGSADDLGMVTRETFPIPEPATLTVLVLGALGLIRRRR